jgi:hypothetical protein
MDFATQIYSEDPLLTQQLELRMRMLERLKSPSAITVKLVPRTPPRNARENGTFGKQVVFKLKLLWDQGGSLVEIKRCFTRFHFFGSKPSSQELRVNVEG